YQNAKVPRFNSKFWNPNSEAINCFSVSWAKENNLLVPPVHLVSRCLRHLLQCKAKGILVTPAWASAAFWPILFPQVGKRAAFIVEYLIMQNFGDIFVDGPLRNKLFCGDNIKYVLVAKLDGNRTGLVENS
ncbi:MAG: hypothetical protein AB2693_33075, partial [Candidatus Thiodiazotropha sp.]